MPHIPEQEDESWTVMNLDSGDMISVDRPVWEQDALLTDEVMVWLEEMIPTPFRNHHLGCHTLVGGHDCRGMGTLFGGFIQ